MTQHLCFLLTIILLCVAESSSQEPTDSVRTALLIIDIQEFYFPGEGPGLSGAEEAGEQAGKVLSIFREYGLPIVHVRHQAEKGFAIHPTVLPGEGEKVITKTEVNSFKGTDLLDFLRSNQIERLVVIGMQTHMCVEAAVRAAHDLDFECIVVEDACATRNVSAGGTVVKAEEVHASTLSTFVDGGYARVTDQETLSDTPEQYLFLPFK